MERDYQNRSHVLHLILSIYYRDIFDQQGLGLVLWDVYDILTRRMTTLTTDELAVIDVLSHGYELEEFKELLPDMPYEDVIKHLQSIVTKFIHFDQERDFKTQQKKKILNRFK